MSTLIVMAHHDSEGALRPHVRRTIERLAADADRFVLVSGSGIAAEHLDGLPPSVDYERRQGPGRLFASYQVGLDLVGDLSAVDTLVLVDDSFVGPTVSVSEIVHGSWTRGYEVVPMTSSMSPRWHAQPYFLAFKEPVLRSAAFRRFWAELDAGSEPADSVAVAVALETTLYDVGFRYGAYFRPDAAQSELAVRRGAWAHDVRLDDTMAQAEERWDPSFALADEFLRDGGLPVLRTDVVLSDPYVLDPSDLLTAAEARYPELLDGVRGSLYSTPHPARRRARTVTAAEARSAGVAYRTTRGA